MRLRLLLPPGWVWVPLTDAAARDRAVDRLVDGTGLDDGQGARLRRDLRRQLLDSARSAADGGASMLALSVGGAVPIPGSVLVTFLPRGLDVQSGAPWLTEHGGRVDTATVTAGPVVRRVGHRDVDLGEGVVLPTLVVDYWITTPEDGLVHVAMSTPLVAHETEMVGLFDAVVEAASWAR